MIEVCLSSGNDYFFGSKHEQGGKLLVFVVDAGGETKVAKNGAFEQISTCRTVNVAMAHIVVPALWRKVLKVFWLCNCSSEIEDDHFGIPGLCNLQTVLVGILEQTVVGIDKLQVIACGHLDSGVTGLAEALVSLTDIGDVIAISH